MRADRLDLDLRHAYGVLSLIEELYEAGRVSGNEALERLDLLFIGQCWRNISLAPLNARTTEILGYVIQKKSGWVRGACGEYPVNVYNIYVPYLMEDYYRFHPCNDLEDDSVYRFHHEFNEYHMRKVEWVGMAVTGLSGNNLYGYALISPEEGRRMSSLKTSGPVKMEGWGGLVTPLGDYTLYAVLPRDEAYLARRWIDVYWSVSRVGVVNQSNRVSRACAKCWAETVESLTSILRDAGVAQIAPEEIESMEAASDNEPFLGIHYGFRLGSITLTTKAGHTMQVTAILRIVDPAKEPALDISLIKAEAPPQDDQ